MLFFQRHNSVVWMPRVVRLQVSMQTSMSHVNFSFVELVQQDNFDLPGDDFSNVNETFQDPGIDYFGIEPSPTDVDSEAAAFCAPQQALSSALHGGPFEDVAEPGPQQKIFGC